MQSQQSESLLQLLQRQKFEPDQIYVNIFVQAEFNAVSAT